MSPAPRRPHPLRSHDPAVVLAAVQDPRVLSGAGLHDLVRVLTTARGRSLGLGAAVSRPADEQPVHALVVLAVARVLLDQLGIQRWDWVRDALTFGAALSDVAHLLGLDVDEVRVGMRSWAWRRRDVGEIDAVECARVDALLDGPPG